MTFQPTVHESSFGGYVKAVYGYDRPEQAAACGDDSVAEMIAWTSDDPKGPKIGWGERIFWWENVDGHEQIWRHRPEPGDLNECGEVTDEATERRGV